jgi:hypothetical protein
VLPPSDNGWVLTAKVSLQEDAQSNTSGTATEVTCLLMPPNTFSYTLGAVDLSQVTLGTKEMAALPLQLTVPASASPQTRRLGCLTTRASHPCCGNPDDSHAEAYRAWIQAVEAIVTPPQAYPAP